MTLALPPEDLQAIRDSGGTVRRNSDGSYTITSGSGDRFQMTAESFEEFASGMGLTIDDLGYYRDQVFGGSVTRLREGASPEYLNSGSLRDVDTVNLPFGTFDDALLIAEAYKTVLYPSRAEQIDRVYHGLDTGRVVSEDIKVSYIEGDGNVTADITTVGNEFDTRETTITSSEVDEAHSENNEPTGEEPPPGQDTEPGQDPASDTEQPEML